MQLIHTWHESCVPFPAHSIFGVILDGLYLLLRHWPNVKMGTWTSCTTEANIPPSDVLPQPTTVPVNPDGSSPATRNCSISKLDQSANQQLRKYTNRPVVDILVVRFLKILPVYVILTTLCRGCRNSRRNDDVWLLKIRLASLSHYHLSQFDRGHLVWPVFLIFSVWKHKKGKVVIQLWTMNCLIECRRSIRNNE